MINTGTISGVVPGGSSGGGGPVTMGGDCSGSSASCTVVALQGKAVSATAPTNGQALIWNNTTGAWTPTTLAAPTFAQVTTALCSGAPTAALQVPYSTGTGACAWLAAPTADGQVLMRVSSALAWAAIPAPTFAQVTTALAGGAPTAALQLPYATSTTAAGWLAAPTADAQVLARVSGALAWTDLSALGTVGTYAITSTSPSLTAAQWGYGYLVLTGTLTGDTTVTLQASSGRRALIRNGTSGAYWLKVVGSGGGSTYLAPGQEKLLWLDGSGVLHGEDLAYWACDTDASLIVGSAGTYTLATIRTPPRLRLQPALVSGLTSLSAGAYGGQERLGTSSGGAQLLVLTGAPAQDAIIGNLATHLGSDADDGGSFFYGSAQSLVWQFVAGGAFTTGSSRLHLQGKLL